MFSRLTKNLTRTGFMKLNLSSESKQGRIIFILRGPSFLTDDFLCFKINI